MVVGVYLGHLHACAGDGAGLQLARVVQDEAARRRMHDLRAQQPAARHDGER